MAAIFVCIVQPKVIEFNATDQKLHRAQKDEELRTELEALSLTAAAPPAPTAGASSGPDVPGELLCQPGGGCRLLKRDPSVSVCSVGSAVCVFEGSLANAAALAEDYAPLPEDEPIAAAPALSGAELICHMYGKVGVEMLGLLRGSFTFVLYESKTSRVLAARDGSGWCPLFQARTAQGSLVLSNSGELLAQGGCHDTLEFLPGDYKYGWSATPRRYQPLDHAKLSRRSLDLPSGLPPHHAGHPPHHGPQPNNGSQPGSSRSASRRASLDHHDFPPAAAGAAAVAAAAGGGGRSRRTSNDHHASPNGCGGPNGSPQPQPLQPPLQPHRTYIVSADDARIMKASVARQQQQQLAAAPPAAAAAAVDGQRDQGGHTHGRGAGARQGHNRRHSMDNHGAGPLGAGPLGAGPLGAGAAAKAGGSPAHQHPPAAAKQQQGQKQQGQPAPQGGSGGSGGGKQGKPGGARVRSGGSRDGRVSHDGRTPTKQQQQQQRAASSAAPEAAIAMMGGAAEVARAALRVEAPEYKPHWASAAGSGAAPVAVATSS